MDYFNELLESYSKLKKRDLHLLEADKAPKKTGEKKEEDNTPTTKELSSDEAYTAAMGAGEASAPITAASWSVIATVSDPKGEKGSTKDILAYKAPGRETKEGGFEAKDDDGNVDAQKTLKNRGGYIVAANASPGGGKANIINADGSKTEHFEYWYEHNFAGATAVGASEDGVVDANLAAAEERAGSQLAAVGFDIGEGLGADIKTELTDLLNRVSTIAQLAQGMGVKDTWAQDSGQHKIGSYVTGPSPQSIERKLAEGKTATISKEWGLKTGALVSEDNADLIAGALLSVNSFAKFSTNEIDHTTSSNACNDLSNQVSKYGKSYVFHSHGDENAGIVLNGSDMFKHFEKQVESICGVDKIQQVPTGVCAVNGSTGNLNEYRGDSLEIAFAAASFYTVLDQMNITTDVKDSLRGRFGKLAREQILRDGKKFDEAHQWAEDLEKAEVATDLDSAFIARAITDLGLLTNTPEKVKNFLAKAFSLERAVTEVFKPQMSIPVGRATGTGIVDDLKYIYFGKNGRDKAERVADSLNLLDDSSTGGRENFDTMTLRELKKFNPEVVQIYQDGHGLSDDDEVYSVGSSIKSYLQKENSKAGEIKNYWRRSSIVHGTNSEQIADGFREVTAARLKFDDIDIAQVRKYQTELDNVYKTLDTALPDDATIMTTADGTKAEIDFDTVIPIIEAGPLKKLPQGSPIRTRIKALFGGTGGKINLKDNASRRTFKEELSRLLVNYKQSSDSNLREEKGKNKGKLTDKARRARKNLAYTSHMVGGVLRDAALNKKVLTDNQVIVTSHMKPIMEATQGIINFDEDDKAVDDYNNMSAEDKKSARPSSGWGVKLFGGTTIKMHSQDSTGKYISLGTKRIKHAKGVRKTSTNLNISSDIAEQSSSIDETIPEWKETSPRVKGMGDSLMINFLKGQSKLLEQLLANQ